MSTELRRTRSRRRGSFWPRVGIIVAALALIAGVGGAASLVQGPRLTGVTVNESSAIEASGSRVIMTTNQALSPLQAKDVTVSPSAEFTVDAQGRNIGVRFTAPLDDDTTYTITVPAAASIGGGPTSTLTTSFTTPSASIYLLERHTAAGVDAIVRMPVDGKTRETVFTHEHIEEFRSAPDALVISVQEGGKSAIIVTDRDGKNARHAKLPGDGQVMSVQVANRGGTFGYLFTDKVLTETTGRASVLYTASLRNPEADPKELQVTGANSSIADWMFVPDAQGILLVNFSGDLLLSNGSDQPTLLGTAYSIDGISRGTYKALIDRSGTPISIDLRTGTEETVNLPAGSGTPGRVEPAPDGEQFWHFTQRDQAGMPIGTSIDLVGQTGSLRTIVSTDKDDPILQFCVSPSAKYVAAIVSPDYPNNPFDRYTRPMQKMQTRIVKVDDGSVVADLPGFDLSWCARSKL